MSAMTPDTVNNGLGGAKLRFMSKGESSHYVPTYRSDQRSRLSRLRGGSEYSEPQDLDSPRTSRDAGRSYYQPPDGSFYSHRSASYNQDTELEAYGDDYRGVTSRPRAIPSSQERTYRCSSPNYSVEAPRDVLDQYGQNDYFDGRRGYNDDFDERILPQEDFETYEAPPSYSHAPMRCRPFIVPQIAYGSGQPFLRGYSNELSMYGISRRDFLEVLDAVNVANTPNPESQIFQKGASIAGWFV